VKGRWYSSKKGVYIVGESFSMVDSIIVPFDAFIYDASSWEPCPW